MVEQSRSPGVPGLRGAVLAYLAVLLAFLAASYFPEYRLWGVNWWAYFPGYVPIVLFGAGVLVAVLTLLIVGRNRSRETAEEGEIIRKYTYPTVTVCLIALYGVCFYLLRNTTHFLGDGYTVLSSLADDSPLVKTRELGESVVHLWVKSIVGQGDTAALLSFQIISISSGVIFLIVVALVSMRLFRGSKKRFLFLLGLATGGYMLLFFGYVENYSLFVLSVAVYSLLGVLIATGKATKWLILPSLALAVFFHVIGIVLVPSAVYLLLLNTKLSRALLRASLVTKLFVVTIPAVVVLITAFHLYSTNYFFRFAFLTPVKTGFTLEGYTLFSIGHLLDYLNLLIVLFPGLPVVLAGLACIGVSGQLRATAVRFLLLLMVSALGTVFVLDPKIGMPRDWDLFSFTGLPVVILGYYVLLARAKALPQSIVISILATTLAVLSVGPRVVAQRVPEVARSHFVNYSRLDKARNRTTRKALIRMHWRAGDSIGAASELQAWESDFPEAKLLDSAHAFLGRGQPLQAIPLLRQVLDKNPWYADAWADLGACLVLVGRCEEAVRPLEISNGLNPYNPILKSHLGSAYLFAGDLAKAEDMLKQSHSLDSVLSDPGLRLTELYALRGDWAQYEKWLRRVASDRGLPAGRLEELVELHLSKQDFRRAALVYRIALRKGLDSARVRQAIEKHPQLGGILGM